MKNNVRDTVNMMKAGQIQNNCFLVLKSHINNVHFLIFVQWIFILYESEKLTRSFYEENIFHFAD